MFVGRYRPASRKRWPRRAADAEPENRSQRRRTSHRRGPATSAARTNRSFLPLGFRIPAPVRGPSGRITRLRRIGTCFAITIAPDRALLTLRPARRPLPRALFEQGRAPPPVRGPRARVSGYTSGYI